MNKTRSFLVGAMLCTAVAAMAWGQKGHDVTTALAERHLTPKTAAAINELLDGKSIVYWSNWLDNASHTPEYAYSKTWHYKNVDADQNYDQVPPFETGDVLTAIAAQSEILRSPDATKEQKALALKILVHLMGDLHQPMHMGHASDLGGNRVYVKFFNSNANLHGIWDTQLVESGHKWSYTEWVDQIDRPTPEELAEMLSGSHVDWGRECVEIAKAIYESTPAESKLSYDEVAKWTPVIEKQLLRGGRRLALVLNTIFDPESVAAE